MSRPERTRQHDGVSCDACMSQNFAGMRYKCLICYDYDLCGSCYESGATGQNHTTDHPMQCIMTKQDMDFFYAGETSVHDHSQAFACPYCNKMGFTENSLQEHASLEHPEATNEVVCPICAAVPGGEPNQVCDDLAAHLALDHASHQNGGNMQSGSDSDVPPVATSGARVSGFRGVGRGRGMPTIGRVNRRSNLQGISAFSRSNDSDPLQLYSEILSNISMRRTGAPGGGQLGTASASQMQQLQQVLGVIGGGGSRYSTSGPRRTILASVDPTLAAAAVSAVNNQQNNTTEAVAASTAQQAVVGGSAQALQQLVSRFKDSQRFLLSDVVSTFNNTAMDSVSAEERNSRSEFVQDLLVSTIRDSNELTLPNRAGSRHTHDASSQTRQESATLPNGDVQRSLSMTSSTSSQSSDVVPRASKTPSPAKGMRGRGGAGYSAQGSPGVRVQRTVASGTNPRANITVARGAHAGVGFRPRAPGAQVRLPTSHTRGGMAGGRPQKDTR